MVKFLVFLLTLQTLLTFGHAGKILMWMSLGSKSHFEMLRPLARALAERKHDITLVTAHAGKDFDEFPNVDVVHIEHMLEDGMNSTRIFDGNIDMPITLIPAKNVENQDKLFANKKIQKLIQEDQNFDVAILSPFSLDMGLYLAKDRYNWPLILFFPGIYFPTIERAMGNPDIPSYMPNLITNFSQKMNFWQRLVNFLLQPFFLLYNDFYCNPIIEAKLQELFKLEERPSMNALLDQADLAFVNAHPLFDRVVPVNPNTIMVAGMHLKPAKVIQDQELKKFLDEAKEGAILVSFGSVLKAKDMPPRVRRILIDNLSKLKHRVVLKWETEEMDDKPSNMLLRKWLPQQDILGHPNVKLFVTHGGLLSNEEALYHRVPIITMPGFGDQSANGARAERQGYGKVLRWHELNETNILDTIQSVLKDDKIRESVTRLGDIFTDNLTPPLEKAVFYTEFAIRHQGAKHLRSPAKELYWFQYFLLDVIAFIVLALLLLIYLVYALVRLVFWILCCCPAKKVGKKIKQQ